MRISLLLLMLIISWSNVAQTSFFEPADTIHKKRIIGTSIGIGTVWAGSITGLSQVWYKNVEKTPFHTFDDSRNWLQMDKIGHFYTAHKISNLSGDLFMWSGMNRTHAAFAGFGTGFGYQLSLELLDAYSSEWGFSWSDVAANTIGSGLYLTQELMWQEQRIIPKFSAHMSPYAKYRPTVLGSNFPERILKDYNGQTYWLSFSPGTFLSSSKYPKWLCFSIGYSADEKLVGDADKYTYYGDFPPASIKEFNAKRQFLFSMDIDFSQLKIKRPWLRVLLKQLNYLKIPFPSLIVSDGKLGGSWIYF